MKLKDTELSLNDNNAIDMAFYESMSKLFEVFFENLAVEGEEKAKQRFETGLILLKKAHNMAKDVFASVNKK